MPLEDSIHARTISLLFGNWLAIARAKRQEFNDAASPMRAYLLAEIEQIGSGGHSPTSIERNHFVSRLPWFKRRRFLKAYKKQREERGNNFRQDYKTGECFYESTDSIVKYLKECLPYTDPR